MKPLVSRLIFLGIALLFTAPVISVATTCDPANPSACICDGIKQVPCDNVDLAGPNNRVSFGGLGVVAGEVDGATIDVASSNMYPYENYSFQENLKYWYDKAIANYSAADNISPPGFKQQITLMGETLPADGVPQNPRQEMLLNPTKTYEDVGFVKTDNNNDGYTDSCNLTPDIDNLLKTARDTFAYDIYYSYPTRDQAISNMRNAVKALANIYMIIADDFLIKALEFRFSGSVTDGLDAKLEEQIKRLTQAQYCYEKGLQSFVYGFGSALGTGEYMSDHYDDAIYSLFNVMVERMSLTLREKSAKEYARSMSSDPTLVEQARLSSLKTLRDIMTQNYLAAVAADARRSENKSTVGVDRMIVAMDAIRSQSLTLRQGLNPLGFDDRYVPMYPPDTLISSAKYWASEAAKAETALKDNRKDLDSSLSSYRITLNSQTDSYKSQLLSMTGIAFSAPDLDYLKNVAKAGEDLLECDTSLPASDFVSCLQGKTGGRLQMKYYQIRDKQFQLEAALTRKGQQEEKIYFENSKYDRLLDIENAYDQAVKTSLNNYMNAVTQARKKAHESKALFSRIVNGIKCVATIAVVTGVTGGTGSTAIIASTAVNTAAKGVADPMGCAAMASGEDDKFELEQKELQLSVKKEIDLQDALKNYRISLNGVQHDESMMNLLHRQAEIEIEVGQAMLQLNMAVKDFANELTEKNNLLLLYVQAYNARNLELAALQDSIAENRVLKTQAAIYVATNLRKGVHYAYLAAKALEYRYLKPIISIFDLYKIQTSYDLNNKVGTLDDLEKNCEYGQIAGDQLRYSLAEDILGLTNDYLDKIIDPNGVMSEAQKVPLRQPLREKEVQAFLSQKVVDVDSGPKVVNLLRFNFATSVFDAKQTINPVTGTWEYRSNVKLWYGLAQNPKCDPITARGIAVKVDSKQISMYAPQITLTQKGHSTFLNRKGQIVEYSPVSQYFNLAFDDPISTVNADDPLFSKSATWPGLRPPDSDPNSSSQPWIWTNVFTNRSFASSDWEMVVMDHPSPGIPTQPIDWSKVKDIMLYMDVLVSTK